MNEAARFTRDFTRLTLRSSSPILILSTRSFRTMQGTAWMHRGIRNGIFGVQRIRFNLLMDAVSDDEQ